jgi:ADP-heptose:LPS heptosyltransferase
VRPVPSASPGRILLIRLKGIGDVILSTPVIRSLRKAFPAAEVDFLTRPAGAPLLARHPGLRRVLTLPERSESFGRKLEFLRGLRKSRYDWVLDLAAEPRSAWLTLATGAPLRAGFAFRVRKWAFTHPIPKNRLRKYQAEVNLDIPEALGVPSDGNRTEIFLGPDEKRWAEEVFRGEGFKDLKLRVGLNPTGTWPSKRWPADHWRRLASLIADHWGGKPILMGGPGEEALLEEVRWGIEGKVLLKPRTGILQAAAFISGLDLLIGNDGTPQHMAQAFGTKSLTLCGPHWGMSWVKPGDLRHRYLQHFLDCGPCDLNVCPFPWTAPRGGHSRQECLTAITPSAVFQAAGEMLGFPDAKT